MALVVFNYHIPEPIGELSITVNGHTYVGTPPALTLFERDIPSALMIAIVPFVGLLVGAIDLGVRTKFQRRGRGLAALIAGSGIALFSIFGLLWGVASLGFVGALVALSALPVNDEGARSGTQ